MQGVKTITEDLLQTITRKIVRKFSPERVILFGSAAEGKAQKNSDIDLFIVMHSRLRRDNRSVAVSKLFADRQFAMDVLVYTPDEIKQSLKRGNFFVKEILEKGRVLYEKR
jgi:predicted nucleotidyltransferase